MGMHFYWLALGILAVWRITHLLNAEDGPWELVVRLRRLAGSGFWAALLDCFYCLSLWIAAPFAYWIGRGWMERLVLWPALSAGAIILERLAPEKAVAQNAYVQEAYLQEICSEETYPQGQEESHVLRQQQTAVSSIDDATASYAGGTRA
jgi:hypothetical protein